MGFFSKFFGISSEKASKQSHKHHGWLPDPLPFETDWKEFSVHAKHKSSNRFRTVKILAKSQDVCEKLAEEQGLLPPYEISELPPNAPSERQSSYAKALHIGFPSDITYNELSDLIDRKVSNGGDTPQIGLAEFAVAHDMHFSRYIGKNRLYDLVFSNLRGVDKIAFFIFCIYRWMSDDRNANLDEHKYKETFYEFAQELQGNSKFIKSMERYSGRNIKFFGTLYGGGYEHEGGSTNTIAFKTVSDYLENKLGLHRSSSKNIS